MANFTEQLKRRLLITRKRDISILRQVVYKELQMWKRQMVASIPNRPMEASELVKFMKHEMRLIADDKKFIDSQIAWLLADDITDVDDELVAEFARIYVKEFRADPTDARPADRRLAEDLEKELTIGKDDKPF